MITFASLFLGLVLGTHPVQLLVDGPVAAVELRLDGLEIARLEQEPWLAHTDFGNELAPHKLEAIALDAEGRELHRTHQWINMARPPAEARLLLEEGTAGRGVRARLVWVSTAGDEPVGGNVQFDGRPVAVDSFDSFELPPHDPAQLHFLRVELHFTEHVSSVVELTFGGTFADQIFTRQTAIPVFSDSKATLSIDSLQGHLSKDGAPLRVLAVDEGPAEIIVVRDGSAQADLDEFVRREHRKAIRMLRGTTRISLKHVGKLGKDNRFRFLSPYPERRERGGFSFELFPPSPEFTREDGGLIWLLSSFRPEPTARGQRLSDAVAVAGSLAAARDRRRAVVLIVGGNPVDGSQLDFAGARTYLEKLRVPLFVWSTQPGITARSERWGESVDVSSVDKLARQMRELRRQLDRQRIVWVEGNHLPQRIVLSPGSGRTSLAM